MKSNIVLAQQLIQLAKVIAGLKEFNTEQMKVAQDMGVLDDAGLMTWIDRYSKYFRPLWEIGTKLDKGELSKDPELMQTVEQLLDLLSKSNVHIKDIYAH